MKNEWPSYLNNYSKKLKYKLTIRATENEKGPIRQHQWVQMWNQTKSNTGTICLIILQTKITRCTLLNGIEYSRRMAGDITVILWRKKAGQAFALLGKNPASSTSPITIHTCTENTSTDNSMHSFYQNNKDIKNKTIKIKKYIILTTIST